MKLPQLKKLAEALDKIKDTTPSLQRLWHDINEHYLPGHAALPAHYRNAWDQAVYARLSWMTERVHSSDLARFKHDWLVEAKFHSLARIHFGQVRIAAQFASALSEYSIQEIAGRQIVDVARDITAGNYARDLISVQVFLRTPVWVAINNRGFAAHCLANKKPLRIIPRLPTIKELNRLNDLSEELVFTPHSPRVPRDRALPSPLIPVTIGQNDLTVIQVVQTICP